jgi:hypothetical protein
MDPRLVALGVLEVRIALLDVMNLAREPLAGSD